jgi:hypothetical protein
VFAFEVLIGHQSVVDRNSTEPSEDPELVHRLTTTLTMRHVCGEQWCAGDVQPPVLACDPDAGLVEMCHRRGPQSLLDPFGEFVEVGSDRGRAPATRSVDTRSPIKSASSCAVRATGMCWWVGR